ncbi:MAG: sirohydrochlorin chelatase, partial [Vicinamibacterales bacterium]
LGLLCLGHATTTTHAGQSPAGILILAHGGGDTWNKAVADLTRRVDQRVPAEVAFGMASRQTIQAAVDRLAERGVRDITAVPLFISSHSSVIESTRYLLGLRLDAPADLEIFARMKHGAHGAAHPNHDAPAADGTTPITTSTRIRMTPALDAHHIVSDILTTRARAISTQPTAEVAILVAMVRCRRTTMRAGSPTCECWRSGLATRCRSPGLTT